jgi:hypothetical protein
MAHERDRPDGLWSSTAYRRRDLLIRIVPSPSLAGYRIEGSLRESRWLREAGQDHQAAPVLRIDVKRDVR